MPVLAIINAKGGSGKSTVATSISAYAAKAGVKLMLGDLDPQQSVRTWLRLRDPTLPLIVGWLLDPGQVFRPPLGVTHAILDTPSGLTGFHLARVVMASNLIIVPVAASAFDREAAQECIENLRRMPRVVSGACIVAVLGMRIPKGSPAEKITRAWAEQLAVKFLGVVRYSPSYSTLVDKGESIFDESGTDTDAEGLRSDWAPLLDWLGYSYFGSAIVKREVQRKTSKIIDEWSRSIPNLSSFTVSKQVPVVPAVLRPVCAEPAMNAFAETAEPLKSPAPAQAEDLPSAAEVAVADSAASDELAPDELVVLVVDGALDLPNTPPPGLFAAVNKGLKRFWGAP